MRTPLPTKTTILGQLLLPLLMLMVIGCAPTTSGASSTVASDSTPPMQVADKPAAAAAEVEAEVDYSCATDAQCTVKNVGSCCGYRPACVNVDSPTFPDRVRAECAAEGRSSICGFEDISACQCVDQRCQSKSAASVVFNDDVLNDVVLNQD